MKLRSASCQLAYWQGGDLRIVNYLTRRVFSANPIALEVIRFFFTPRSIGEALVEFRAYSRKSVAQTVLKLIEAQLLLEVDSPDCRQDTLAQSHWKPWLPEGGFHFMTKDARYVRGDWTVERKMKALPKTPPPPQFKALNNGHSIALPRHQVESDSFFQTVHARRTHREFGQGNLSLESVSKLLQTTWGIQGYLDTNVFGKLPYKTSPSGGARHPVEVYLMALKVDGLETGIYHYQARDHLLEKLDASASARRARAYCADQLHVAEAAALFIMTAVFSRTMWKYHNPRAYRVVLLDAGHLCQTFCLAATRMGLAPFSTAALKDTLIEKDLGLDGISESVLYVAGVGLLSATASPRPTSSPTSS